MQRWPQQRTEGVVVVDGQTIRFKQTAGRIKIEHDDALAAATALSLPLRDVLQRAEREVPQ